MAQNSSVSPRPARLHPLSGAATLIGWRPADLPQATPAAAILPPTPDARPADLPAPVASAAPVVEPLPALPAREPTRPEFPVALRPAARRRRPEVLHRVATVRGWPSDPALLSSPMQIVDGVARPLARPVSSPALTDAATASVASAPVDARPSPVDEPPRTSTRSLAPRPTRWRPSGLVVTAAVLAGACALYGAYGLVQRLVTMLAG